MSPAPVLVVHGGAGRNSKPEDRLLYMAAVAGALDAGFRELERGAGPAVVAAVEYMERDPSLNAGLGAVLDAEARVSLDAGFMEGAGKRYGAVTCVTRCITPVVLAQRLSEDGEFGRFIAGDAADRLATRWNVAACDPDDLVTTRSRARHLVRALTADTDPGADTVGAVALDARGHVAAAVSTGGIACKPCGRVGDSPVVGAGFWAEDRVGACVTTGVGEVLLRQGTARRCVELIAAGRSPAIAARLALAELIDHDGDERGTGGLIVVAHSGETAIVHSTAEMPAGCVRTGQSAHTGHLWADPDVV